MLKYIIIIIFSFTIINPVFAINSTQWEEFCPVKYLNAEYHPHNKIVKYSAAIFSYGLVGLPIGLPLWYADYHRYKNNYWYNRRIIFNQRMGECNSIQDQGLNIQCYMKVRELEYRENNNIPEFKYYKLF
jgi:hypothetical protein